MKRAGQRSRLAAIEAALAPGGTVIKIEGGMPETAAAAGFAELVQLELPLPAPSRPSRGAGRVFTKPPAKDAPAASAGDPGPAPAPDWEQTYWRSQHRRRDQGR